MLIKSALIIIFLLSAILTAVAGDNDYCFKCHNWQTLGLIDSSYNRIKSYYVNKSQFENSNHKRLQCVNCHDGCFNTWPHNSTKHVSVSCNSCHRKQSVFKLYGTVVDFDSKNLVFEDFENEFFKSVHKLKFGTEFTCFTCHNPHSFDRSNLNKKEKIEHDNSICTNCHGNRNKEGKFRYVNEINLDETHNWLPNFQVHNRSVRCIDCHSSKNDGIRSHVILPKQQAVKNCEGCHSKNSLLLSKLYTHEHKSYRRELGFINGVLLNDAYVIGSTRNEFLDNLSIIFSCIVLIAVLGHGILRIIIKLKSNVNK
ncbi:MAG: hypothetical protein RBT61_10875 [Candidatus Kapabacteria bacterium]|jgi:hypothetical protein|nr:hypothetical protein [Candidatus Kapabacteria bacterium]